MEMIGNHHNHPLPPHLVTNNSDLKDFHFFHLNFQILKLQILKLFNHVQRMTDAKLDDAAALQHLEHLGVEDGNAMFSNFEQQKRHEKNKDKYKSQNIEDK